nr:protein EURL homolog isoform X1 [Odocoileus virginianus texanus]
MAEAQVKLNHTSTFKAKRMSPMAENDLTREEKQRQSRGTMNEEEQFVSIDLNDDNICSVCKLGTDKETLSFCHVCFELNIDGKDTG